MKILIILSSIYFVTLASCHYAKFSNKGGEIKDFKIYKEKFSEDPEKYVKANIAKGDYRYWGFRQRNADPKMRWIPGITGPKKELGRVDFVSLGLEVNDATNGAAEKFFKSYNLFMKKERRIALNEGKKFDVYWNQL